MSDDMAAWLRAELDRREQTARAAGGDEWHLDTADGRLLDLVNGKPATVGTFPMVVVRGSGGAVAQRMATGRDDEIARGTHIADNDPASVLRRIAADRKTLDLHAAVPDHGRFSEDGCPAYCDGTHDREPVCRACRNYAGDPEEAPCATVLLLAEGYGWAGEQR